MIPITHSNTSRTLHEASPKTAIRNDRDCGARRAVWPARILVVTLALSVAGCSSAQPAKKASEADGAWSQAKAILKRIVPPKFPDKDFDITSYGATGDGTTDCTEAFKKAIAACNKAGGGRVVVPKGTFLTGAIHLKSGVNLHVTKEATIKFSSDPKMFLPVVFTRYECTEVMNFSPLVYAYGQKNIAITGEGTLDGQGDVWHKWLGKWNADSRALVEMGNKGVPVSERVFGDGHYLRPTFVQPVRCRNVLIEGVRVINSPMWVISPLYCTNVTIRGVSVVTRGPNTDGCDPDSCTDVLIENCHFNNGDDCIAIKSGRDLDGRRVNIPSANIVIRNCTFEAGHGGITMGSETAGGIKNVFAENCQLDSPDLDMALRFKTNPARGGYIENVHIRNCTTKTAKFGIHMTLRYSAAGARDGDAIPIVRNIDIRDCTFATLTRAPIFIEGYSPEIKITDVTIADCTFGEFKSRSTITNAERISLVNVQGSGLE